MSIVRSISNAGSFANSIPGDPATEIAAKRVIEAQNWCGENRPGNVHFSFRPLNIGDYLTDIFVTNGVPIRFAIRGDTSSGIGSATYECLDSQGSVHEITVGFTAVHFGTPVSAVYDKLPPGWCRVRIIVASLTGDAIIKNYYCGDAKQTLFFPPGPIDVAGDFAWALEYHGTDLVGASWPAYLGRGVTLLPRGSNANVNIDNLHDFRHLGLLQRQWNKSVAAFSTGNHAYRVASGQVWPADANGAFHARFIVRPDLAVSRNWFFHGQSGGARWFGVGATSATNIRFQWASNGTLTANITAANNKPMLVDVDCHPTAAGGNGRMRVYINKVLAASVNHSAAQSNLIPTEQFNLLGTANGNASLTGPLAFFAARGGLISQAQHDYACDRLNLSGGPT